MHTPADGSSEIEELAKIKNHSRPGMGVLVVIGGMLALLLAIGLSISFGAADIKIGDSLDGSFSI